MLACRFCCFRVKSIAALWLLTCPSQTAHTKHNTQVCVCSSQWFYSGRWVCKAEITFWMTKAMLTAGLMPSQGWLLLHWKLWLRLLERRGIGWLLQKKGVCRRQGKMQEVKEYKEVGYENLGDYFVQPEIMIKPLILIFELIVFLFRIK